MIYSQEDYAAARKAFRKDLMIVAFITVVFLFALAALIQTNHQVKGAQFVMTLSGMIITVLWFCLLYFLVRMRVWPDFCYARLVNEALTNRKRSFRGRWRGYDEKPVERDKNYVYLASVQTDETDRSIYLDARKPLPEIEKGAVVDVTLYGYLAVGITPSEGD